MLPFYYAYNDWYIHTSMTLITLVDCEWGDYGDWSECSESCGNGTEFRDRVVKISAQHGGQNCTGEAREQKQCNTHPCAGKEYLLCITTSCFFNILT